MPASQLRLGGAALNQTPLDWAGNKRRILQAVSEAESQGIDLLCMPELALPGYGCEDVFLADFMPTRCLEELADLLPASESIAFTIGLPIVINRKRYNGQALLGGGRILGIALKHNLANDGVYYEPRWFSAWPKGHAEIITLLGQEVPVGHTVFTWKGQRIAFEICEEAWRGPDRLAHFYVDKSVDVILNPSASHFRFGKERSRHHLAQEGSRLIEGAYVYVNFLGNESGRLLFDGDIVIYRNGKLLTEAEPFRWSEMHVLGEGAVAKVPNYLPAEAEFEQAATLGLYDYMRKSKSKGFCLSLSGGADSACCAILVHRMGKRLLKAYLADRLALEQQLAYWPALVSALDKGEITSIMPLLLACLYQRSENSSKQTLEAAARVGAEIECLFDTVSIGEMVNQYKQAGSQLAGRPLTWAQDDLTLQNIQARVRAPLIWLWANLRNSLLITTSNRSEGSVGYATMDGDMAGGLAPLVGVSKHFIKKWLVFAQETWGYSSLVAINALAPTAELRPLAEGQTDEADLMPYDLLDQIEHLLVYHQKSKEEAFSILLNGGAYSPEYLRDCLEKFAQLWKRNQWKRERMAPGFHLDAYSIDPKSWKRYPILSGE